LKFRLIFHVLNAVVVLLLLLVVVGQFDAVTYANREV
jgi:hypothetical protein